MECIVSLPDQLFFNTGITTYLWILSNKKSEERRGKVQLIDGSSLFVKMKKSLGNKRKEVSPTQRDEIVNLYLNFEEGERCQIHPNEFFGYTKVHVEQPIIEDGSVVTDKKGNPKPDTSKRDYERVPLTDDIEVTTLASWKSASEYTKLPGSVIQNAGLVRQGTGCK